ncbi:hypothetical protein BB561_003697 [Smittium simulii]|uniref:Glutaredoxin domain-containing protein n=1 Tax=Smittium simulii TaxID=133385 RepID=A0A2T9YJZ9_9FUNG|nr:hypothetical protein BB561_003697 [Smittium simulii]
MLKSLQLSKGLISLVAPRSAFNPIFTQKRLLSEDLRSQIQKQIDASKVTVFMKGTPSEPLCGFSNFVIQVLKIHGVKEIKGVNCLEDPEIRTGIKEFSQSLVYYTSSGSDIIGEMHKSGELSKLLTENGIIEPEKN